ncbi:hypothetical protein AC1031_004423 [Aphanomyces cochlioides]|nr:hypothetical protein AC1031_004423 [Aphanomyces cochlioides]
MSGAFELTPHRRVVYLDESYIRQNYARLNDSIFYPYDKLDKPPKIKHKDLQPIEYVWAYVKGVVGRQYTTETTMDDVRSRLEVAFGDLRGDLIHRCINHTKKRVLDLKEYIVKLEASDEAANEAPLIDEDEYSNEDESDEDEGILSDAVNI